MDYFLVHVKVDGPMEDATKRLEGFLTKAFGESNAYVAEDFGTGHMGQFHAMMVGVYGDVNTTKEILGDWLNEQDPESLGWISEDENPLHAPEAEHDSGLNRAVQHHWGNFAI